MTYDDTIAIAFLSVRLSVRHAREQVITFD